MALYINQASRRTCAALHTLCKFEAHILRSSAVSTRSILSDAYSCRDAWDERFQDPILRTVDPDKYFVDLSKKFGTKTKASAVDVDIYLNKVKSKDTAAEFENVLNRLRRSRHTVNTLLSTHAAAVRYFLDHEMHDTLMKILQKRLDYGIFPDTFTSNILMDTFLKRGNHRDAAKVAIEMMLQEDAGNAITRILALHSCHMYLREPKPEPWDPNPPPVQDDDDDEEVYVRVPNIINPFFDDHFDLNDPQHQIGKTLMMFCEGQDDVLHCSYYIIGCGLYQKWEKALEFIKQCSSSKKQGIVTRDALERFRSGLSASELDAAAPIREELENSLKALETLACDEDLHELAVAALTKIPALEQADIEAQKKNFVTWQELRREALEKQTHNFLREQAIEVIRAKKKELGRKEELLYAFENWDQIEMKLAEVEEEEAALAAKDTTEQEYIPPDVQKPLLSKER
ncbi:small ribosomal subunit protein mS27-like [Ornithodoros turicata]|uniref:small ribosomal subunit protein mS27-like n=1 Tax=Ornithodoros turicata TaxID=34597 RepID=UPI0031397FE2